MSSPDDNGFTPGDTLTPAEPRKRFTLGALSKTTLALFAAVGLATVAAGGTYAYLNSAAPVSDVVTITSGTAALSVGQELTGWTTLYPGVTAYGTATIANEGDVPLDVTATASVGATTPNLNSAVALRIGVVSPATGPCGMGFTGPWTGTFAGATASPVALGTFGTNAPTGESQVLCVAITLPQDAPSATQGLSTSFSFAINGTQAN